ncbi:NUDIX hydrolase [Actinomadura craniellae]|uniref:NUDIX hydrolase n=1 Tax=Actinomadura craniellae TaxID=2231787 RepID=A0A365H2S9_9ACTN|nr:NUDIX domain-containing protein [Actinomadura craniellae]RAY13326.1 NUDIX hydrolase [Actinomadura craniellae]
MTGPRGDLHADVVRVLTGWQAPDAAQEALRGDFLAHLATHPDGVWRGCVPGHITASSAVFDATGERVLLTLHPKVGLWLQLGGHCEPGDGTLAEAALREATEESGIAGLRLLPDPVRIDRHAVRCHPEGSYHLDVQYAAIAPAGARAHISTESDDLRWFPVDALPELSDAVLHRLVAGAHPLLATTPR